MGSVASALGLRIRFLGTGGAANERRHQASILLEWHDDARSHRVLLDTGSGLDIVRQVIAAGCQPTAVHDIFVSHQHVDHVGGLEPLLLWTILRQLRDRGGPPPEETRVHAEPRVLGAIDRVFDAVATAVPRLFAGRLHWLPRADGQVVDLPGGGHLTTFLVDHEPVDGGAMGCLVEVGGLRVVYSGDTRPSPRLAEWARGADVLLHEAGGLDVRADQVRRQGHSTAGDAGRIARAANVDRLILVHVPDDGLADAMLAEARAEFGRAVELAEDLGLVEV
jgi:ribonuclease Z